jgi:hypothetical protein
LKASLAQGDHDPLLATADDERFPGNGEGVGFGPPVDHHLGEHIGFQHPVGIGEPEPNPQGTGTGIQFRVDVVHLAFPDPTGQRGHLDASRLAGADPIQLVLEHVHLHPDRGNIADGEQLYFRFDEHALPQTDLGHHAVGRGENRYRLLDLAGFGQLIHEALGQFQQAQPASGRLPHVPAVCTAPLDPLQGQQKFFLGIDDFRGIKLHQPLTALDRISFGPHQQLFHPAGGPGMQVGDAIFVIGDIAYALDTLAQLATLGERRAHAHVLQGFRTNGDNGGAGIRPIGVGGNLLEFQVHTANGAVARFVPHDLRVHGADVFRVPMFFRVLDDGIVHGLRQALAGRFLAGRGLDSEKRRQVRYP